MKKIFLLLVVLSLFLVAACSLPSPNDVGIGQEDSEVEESDDGALAGNAKATPNICKGLKDSPLDQCPTKTGRQRYCKEGKLLTQNCPTPAVGPDGDSDRVPDSTDNCPNIANSNQNNRDNDVFGDSCDLCPSVVSDSNRNSDGAGDRIADDCDNCPSIGNPTQTDNNLNSIGDACEAIGSPLCNDFTTVPLELQDRTGPCYQRLDQVGLTQYIGTGGVEGTHECSGVYRGVPILDNFRYSGDSTSSLFTRNDRGEFSFSQWRRCDEEKLSHPSEWDEREGIANKYPITVAAAKRCIDEILAQNNPANNPQVMFADERCPIPPVQFCRRSMVEGDNWAVETPAGQFISRCNSSNWLIEGCSLPEGDNSVRETRTINCASWGEGFTCMTYANQTAKCGQ